MLVLQKYFKIFKISAFLHTHIWRMINYTDVTFTKYYTLNNFYIKVNFVDPAVFIPPLSIYLSIYMCVLNFGQFIRDYT